MSLTRLGDLAYATVLLIVCLPALTFACVALWLENAQSPFVSVKRVTQDGRHVRLVRLRTTERVGAFIGSLNVDAVPQLLNVLRGDVSLLAPDGDGPVGAKKALAALRER